MTTDAVFIDALTEIVGTSNVRTSAAGTKRFRTGFRSGDGEAEAVVIPGTLLEMWRVLQTCVAANRIVIMQAANTGLTEGSTPKGEYDRDVVIINTLRMDKIHVLKNGHQIVGHPGSTLYKLERMLKPLGREPHSVIGSTNIGASIVGGVCNNSGGALTQRGPAYTELALYAQVGSDGVLRLVNHLGIDLGDTPEEILERLEQGQFSEADVHEGAGRASDDGYAKKVRDVTASTPSRYNADPDRLFEASGSAGRLAVFAVRLDTYPAIGEERVYYIGTNDPADLTALRRRILTECTELPICGEYVHRDLFDVARKYGKDTLMMIHWFGTDRLPLFFAIKGALDARLNKIPFLPSNLVDRMMQMLSALVPEPLPKRMLDWRSQYEHHLILKVGAKEAEATETILAEVLAKEAWFSCTAAEAKKAMLHRFAAAGAAVRYHAVHTSEVEDVIALDIALARNDENWFENLPEEIEKDLIAKLYYGHFFCHVFHQDYVVRKGADPKAIKQKMLALLDRRNAEYPAEHNVGHLYGAKPALAEFYEALDPTNSFNPGIGKTSKQKRIPTPEAEQHA
ncbi:MAG: D-lactate dehydrogenase [Roseibium sp.]|uniref:D-lactate dehydrogenase n=1 Tax=Roseibium sp. TaxID=1936156 RepID=UPI001B0A158A|nr:D-lactate dehydrogenase [Roseibium sp.]MBO6891621.1 D-lactate dehydrogenase [Roseibium sp.]MBO6933048.1 D-lactate dehydrogenase [Roseibium sp.]